MKHDLGTEDEKEITPEEFAKLRDETFSLIEDMVQQARSRGLVPKGPKRLVDMILARALLRAAAKTHMSTGVLVCDFVHDAAFHWVEAAKEDTAKDIVEAIKGVMPNARKTMVS